MQCRSWRSAWVLHWESNNELGKNKGTQKFSPMGIKIKKKKTNEVARDVTDNFVGKRKVQGLVCLSNTSCIWTTFNRVRVQSNPPLVEEGDMFRKDPALGAHNE